MIIIVYYIAQFLLVTVTCVFTEYICVKSEHQGNHMKVIDVFKLFDVCLQLIWEISRSRPKTTELLK